MQTLGHFFEPLYMRQTTYTRVHISVEAHGISRNIVSKEEHISDTIESDNMMNAVHR